MKAPAGSVTVMRGRPPVIRKVTSATPGGTRSSSRSDSRSRSRGR